MLLLVNSGVKRTWSRILNGHCGIVSTRHLGEEFKALPSQVAALVPVPKADVEAEEGVWVAKDHVSATVRSILTVNHNPVVSSLSPQANSGDKFGSESCD